MWRSQSFLAHVLAERRRRAVLFAMMVVFSQSMKRFSRWMFLGVVSLSLPLLVKAQQSCNVYEDCIDNNYCTADFCSFFCQHIPGYEGAPCTPGSANKGGPGTCKEGVCVTGGSGMGGSTGGPPLCGNGTLEQG